MGIAILVPGADFRSNNLGQVTPARSLPLQGITIEGVYTAYISAQYTAILTPTFTSQRNVTWSIVSGSQYATISSSGILAVKPNVSGESVTIRCTSIDNPSIYAEKTIQVISASVSYFDWIVSDGTDFVVMPGLSAQWTGKLVVRTTLTGANTYTFQCWYSAQSTQASLSAYNNSNNLVSARVGNLGYRNYVAKINSVIYRYEWNLGINNDGSFNLYNEDSGSLIGSETGAKIEMSGLVYIFRAGVGASSLDVPEGLTPTLTPSGAKFYGLIVYDANNNVIANYKPAIYDGVSGIHDTISGIFRGGYMGTGGLSCGND